MHESRVEHGVARLCKRQGKSYNLENFTTKLQLVAKICATAKIQFLKIFQLYSYIVVHEKSWELTICISIS